MKKTLLYAAILATIGFIECAPQYRQETYLVDYRPYQKDGFTITPSSSGFVYESLGNIYIVFVDGVKKGYTNPNPQYPYQQNMFIHTYELMVSEMVKKTKELGANALLNFQIIQDTENPRAYIASGFAVKLK